VRILREESVLVLIDVQERLFPHIYNHEPLAQNIEVLLKGSTELKIPVILSEQYKKGLGETLFSLKQCFEPIHSIEKISFSCLGNASFYDFLAKANKKHVILVGIESHICVLQTAIDLKANNYEPIVVIDAVSSRKELDKIIAIERLIQEGVILTTCESLLFEWCRKAGTDEFKAISKLVK